MIDERFKIYVEQLRDGHSEILEEKLSPEFLEIKENALAFNAPISIKGEAYLADEMLVLHLDISTFCAIPCRICNEPVKIPLSLKGSYHAIPLKEIKGAVFNFRELLRETILLEVPPLAECAQGKCPQRQTLKKYFRQEVEGTKQNQEEGHRPFAGLDFDQLKENK